MAANAGWFADWWQDGQFPPVWFAPADETHLTPAEIRTGGNVRRVMQKRPRMTPVQVTLDRIPPREESEALLLLGIL